MLLCFLLIGGSVAAQVRFDADFECGNLGPVSQTRSPKVRNGVKHYYYYVGGHNDPDNPVDIDLRANGNWYYFRITGAAKKYFHLSMPDNFVAGASWSYDGVQWQHLTAAEADQHSINKYFKRDTVYIALYKPYTYSYLQERLLDWSSKPFVTLDTIGLSHERRPLQMMHSRLLPSGRLCGLSHQRYPGRRSTSSANRCLHPAVLQSGRRCERSFAFKYPGREPGNQFCTSRRQHCG